MNDTIDTQTLRAVLRIKTILDNAKSTYMGFSFFYIVLGSALNIWLLGAILSSPKLRSSMRNKLLCSLFLLHLTESALRLPASFVVYAAITHDPTNDVSCDVFSFLANATLIQDFTANWLLVIILSLFIAKIEEYNPTRFFSPSALNVVTVALLVLPWLGSLILIPATMLTFHQRIDTNQTTLCLLPTREALPVFKLLDTAVPVALSILLVSIAALLIRRKYPGGVPTVTMDTQLMGAGVVQDRILPYALAVGVSCLCEFSLFLTCLQLLTSGLTILQRFQLYFASYILSDSRVLLIPLAWLYLPELRERIQTWRPWIRTSEADNDMEAISHKEDE